jgi:hypothetical protein
MIRYGVLKNRPAFDPAFDPAFASRFAPRQHPTWFGGARPTTNP